MNPIQTKIVIILGGIVFIFTGCERTVLVREYKEIHIEAEQKRSMPMDEHHAFLQAMPQDAIHANLNSGNMDMAMQTSPQLEASVDRSPLKWVVPQGWSEQKGSGMRLATLNNADSRDPVETTIISLSGSAGGINSNIIRWMQQVNIKELSPVELTAFLDKQERLTTAGELPALVIDLTLLQLAEPAEAPSIIAAIIEREQAQIFIKMTGSKQAVLKNRDDFLSLVRSIEALE